MSTYIYLSITPEALIGSMLPPVDFGAYLATGTKKCNKGQAIFFEIDPGLSKESIDMNYLNCRCIAKPDGSPKSSVYLSVYRVLESIPMKAFKSLYLTTESGIVLELKRNPYDKTKDVKDKSYYAGFEIFQIFYLYVISRFFVIYNKFVPNVFRYI